MRKNLSFLSLALAALWLVPQSIHADDCQFIPDLFPGQAADRTETEVNATVHVGEYGPESYDNTHLINSLASSNENVVKVSSNGGYNAAVYFAAVGIADVTYTETIQRSSCTGVEQAIHYTVNKGTPTLYFAGQDGMPVTEYTAAKSQGGGGGDAAGGGAGGEGGGGSYVWTPSYYARYMVLNESRGYRFVSTAIPVGELTFNSTNPAVATINASGQTTVVGYGSTVISVSWPGNDNWEAGQASYTLNVKKAANIYFNPSNITDTVDNVIKLNVVCPEGVTISSWSSSNTTYATVDNEGNVTLKKVGGPVNIYAYSAENAEYASAVCACQINIVKRIPNIYFSPNYVELEYGVTPYALPELIKPADLDANLYKWRISKEDFASINPTTGALTIYGTGVAQVYYYTDKDTDPKYEMGGASYALRVTTSGVYVNGVLVTSANPDVLGDGSIIYSVEPGVGKFLTFDSLHYVAAGGTFIQADEPLNILVKGNCSISGAGYAIQASSSVFLWCQNNKDTISIDAQYVAIQAGSLKVHDCYLFATAGLYPIYTQTGISVSAGGYIFANATGQNIGGKGTPEAIVANHFIKGEGGIGGINVLTKGVTFHEAGGEPGTGGFFTNYAAGERATFVEIGKVPLPLADDDVTNIDFETEDPHNNLDVVFSESANDAFNEAEKQIEIKTTTDSQTLTNTLAAYVTCSSDWLKALPGVLVFDVPAGQGEIAIQCELDENFILQAHIEGVGSATISWANPGWAKIQYNVVQQTHVIVYLQTTSHASAPAKAPAKTSSITSGAAIKSIKITPGSVDKYYVFGSFNGWAANENYRLTLNQGATTTEYMMELPLTTTDQFKVVKVDGENKTWYPGEGSNYGENGEIQEDGNYTIYFRPNGDGGQDWFYNVIYVAKVTPSAIDNVNANGNAVKVLRDGQIFILRGDKTYTLQGQVVR